MSTMWPDRSVIYLVHACEDFTPESPWEMPPAFSAGQVYARNVPLEDARATVRVLNKTNLDAKNAGDSTWNHRWAIVAACARAKGLDRLIKVVSARIAARIIMPPAGKEAAT